VGISLIGRLTKHSNRIVRSVQAHKKNTGQLRIESRLTRKFLYCPLTGLLRSFAIDFIWRNTAHRRIARPHVGRLGKPITILHGNGRGGLLCFACSSRRVDSKTVPSRKQAMIIQERRMCSPKLAIVKSW
jgi:hypothetical protein